MWGPLRFSLLDDGPLFFYISAIKFYFDGEPHDNSMIRALSVLTYNAGINSHNAEVEYGNEGVYGQSITGLQKEGGASDPGSLYLVRLELR